MRKIHVLVLAGVASVAAMTAWAAETSSGKGEVEKAVQAREPLPMEDIMQRAKAAQAGRIEEIELEHKGGRLLYEVNIAADDGAKRELKFDAKTGELISNKVDDEDDDDDD
jgi:uncharacterized membrane protein YkoI